MILQYLLRPHTLSGVNMEAVLATAQPKCAAILFWRRTSPVESATPPKASRKRGLHRFPALTSGWFAEEKVSNFSRAMDQWVAEPGACQAPDAVPREAVGMVCGGAHIPTGIGV